MVNSVALFDLSLPIQMDTGNCWLHVTQAVFASLDIMVYVIQVDGPEIGPQFMKGSSKSY